MARLALLLPFVAILYVATSDFKRPPENTDWPEGLSPPPTMQTIMATTDGPLTVPVTEAELAVLQKQSFGDPVDVTYVPTNGTSVVVQRLPMVGITMKPVAPGGPLQYVIVVGIKTEQAARLRTASKTPGSYRVAPSAVGAEL